jgi:hypothetical protein
MKLSWKAQTFVVSHSLCIYKIFTLANKNTMLLLWFKIVDVENVVENKKTFKNSKEIVFDILNLDLPLFGRSSLLS